MDEVYHARWLFHARGSGLWFDPGRTIAFQKHFEVNEHFNADCPCHLYGYNNCAAKKAAFHTDECPTVSPQALRAAREQGYDSIQIMAHDLDGSGPSRKKKKFEIVDLALPYVQWPPDGTLMQNYYYGGTPGDRPCVKRTLPQVAGTCRFGQRYAFGHDMLDCEGRLEEQH